MTLEVFDHGISREFLAEGRIVVIASQGDMRRIAVDQWANIVTETYRAWTPGQPILALLDLSAPSQTLTPYARQRADEAYDAADPDTPARGALLLKDGFAMRIISMFVRERKGRHKQSEVRIFVQRTEALRWLHEQAALFKTTPNKSDPFAEMR